MSWFAAAAGDGFSQLSTAARAAAEVASQAKSETEARLTNAFNQVSFVPA